MFARQLVCVWAPTIVVMIGAAAPCGAWELRCRFVERVGNVDVLLPGDTIDAGSLLPRRIRAQFGVFDSDTGAAPLGGYLGWNVGTIAVLGSASNSNETRTPGRLAPFNFASGPNANGAPAGNPFESLSDIDNTLGTQSPLWICNPDGTAPPPPNPGIRGRNVFVSTYEFTIDPADAGAVGYSIRLGGNLIAADRWLTVGNPTFPDCSDPGDPSDDITGSITYAPFPLPPQPFECTLTVVVPAPAAGAGLVAGVLMLARRRR